jgi:hypothetical protein
MRLQCPSQHGSSDTGPEPRRHRRGNHGSKPVDGRDAVRLAVSVGPDVAVPDLSVPRLTASTPPAS